MVSCLQANDTAPNHEMRCRMGPVELVIQIQPVVREIQIQFSKYHPAMPRRGQTTGDCFVEDDLILKDGGQG